MNELNNAQNELNQAEKELNVLKHMEKEVDTLIKEAPKSDAPLTNLQKAQIGLTEICDKYGITEYHIGQVLTGKFEEKTRTIAASNKVIKTEYENRKGLTEYHELIARDITAMKIIDNHNNEMQGYFDDVKKMFVEWLHFNAPEGLKDAVDIMCTEMNIPAADIRNRIHNKIVQEAEQLMIEKMNDFRKKELDEAYKTLRADYDHQIKDFVINISKASRYERKQFINEYLKK